MAWNSPSTWVPNTVLTAADLNREVRDNFNAIGDAGTTYTPTWTASTTNPTIGNGTLTGNYNVAGKRLWFWMSITMGSTTTYGAGTWIIGLPIGLNLAPGFWNFNGTARDLSAGGALYPVFAQPVGTTAVAARTLPSTAGNALAAINATNPVAWASGDSLFIHGEAQLA